MGRITREQADELARVLEVDVDDPAICHACLCMVSFALEGGDEADIRRTTSQISRNLWDDGLDVPVAVALERARKCGVPHAEAAIAAVERSGPRCGVVHAIVRRLGADLTKRTRDREIASMN
jgi:hypothetical protein